MSAVPVRPSRQEVRKRAEEIKQKIETTFPNVDVEVADWDDLIGEAWDHWKDRGFPLPRPWIHAYVLIRGDQETTEEAACLADAEVARLLEETDVVVEVKRTKWVRCEKSVALAAFSVPAVSATSSYVRETGGVVFSCWFDDPHHHDFGRLQSIWESDSG